MGATFDNAVANKIIDVNQRLTVIEDQIVDMVELLKLLTDLVEEGRKT
jgi:hypothetical protein